MTVQSRVDAIFDRPPEQGVSLVTVVMHRAVRRHLVGHIRDLINVVPVST